MNTFYNADKAREQLHSFLNRGKQEEGSFPLLSEFCVEETDVMEQYRSHRMVQMKEDDPAEVNVRIPGIMCWKLLPPVSKELRGNVSRARQQVKVTGLGLPEFDDMNINLQAIYKRFKAWHDDKHVITFEDVPYEGHYSIEAHCRYFTDRRSAPMEQAIPFGHEVDPFHYLESSAPATMIHLQDNEVQYCRKQYGTDGTARYMPLSPQAFHTGDLVELLVSFVSYRVGNEVRDESLHKLQSVQGNVGKRKRGGQHRAALKRQLIVYDTTEVDSEMNG
ncbi:hypothetical protein BJ165DRAFT_1406164 [Panaeolus papilionaceus]|nr:hypothetical protein BJ165DRAFT_1406164 [Panaeolus papilionaceus]